MNLKNQLFGLGALVMLATPAFAAEDLVAADAFPGTFTGNVALTSEYVFRGISQSDDRAAVQGGFNYAYDFGPVTGTLGIWGSNVNFADASVELDYMAGLGGKFMDVAWNAGFIYYNYPGSNSNVALDQDYYEGWGSLGYDFGLFAATVAGYYSPDYQADSGDSFYLNGGVVVPVGKFFDVKASVGKIWIERNRNFGTTDYVDYKIGVGTKIAGLDLDLAWTDTNMSQSECNSGNCNSVTGILVLTVAKTF